MRKVIPDEKLRAGMIVELCRDDLDSPQLKVA